MESERREKRCPSCERTLPAAEFYSVKGRYDGLYWQCKACARIDGQKSRKANGPRLFRNNRNYVLKKNFGISINEYDAMVARRNNRCDICGQPPENTKSLAVDHCHSTGDIRGLLCGRCNKALGLLGDDAASVRRALDYLERFEAKGDAA